ncbi:MAG TPA: putative sugar nucleotidyl transferase, partial [Dongiaceae bacterium]|nr:putative sugar nucleotidyl transferase [Dongiaceae bacterium]
GASCLAERISTATGLQIAALAARADALTACRTKPRAAGGFESGVGTALFVNAAALPGAWLRELLAGDEPVAVTQGDRLLGARVAVEPARAALAASDVEAHLAGLGLPSHPAETRVIEHPWQLMEWNAEAITADLARLAAGQRGDVHASVAFLGDGRVSVELGARVDPFCVIDARNGPVVVRRRALVGAHTVLVGPCVVGEGTQLLGGMIARTTIGRECRIAGEVEDCVWQGFVNKRHHGFVGHSVIGEWVNLGALTTTSDLKNNYGTVRVTVDGSELDTGATKIGSVIGAHVKTGIGTLLPTGAVVGTGANLFGGGRFAPKSVPSFGWWDGKTMIEHRLERFIRTAQTAMS